MAKRPKVLTAEQKQAFEDELSGLEDAYRAGGANHMMSRRIMWLRRWLGLPESGEKPKPKGAVPSPDPKRYQKRQAGEAPQAPAGKTTPISK